MGRTEPLTRAEREEIYRRKLAGETLQEIAACHPRSVEAVRKWWRRARDHGLAGLEERKVNANGVLSLGGLTYSVGHQHAGKRVRVRFDPTTQEWLFLENGTTGQQEIARRTLKELDIPSLTGLDIQPLLTPLPIQLSLPCLA